MADIKFLGRCVFVNICLTTVIHAPLLYACIHRDPSCSMRVRKSGSGILGKTVLCKFLMNPHHLKYIHFCTLYIYTVLRWLMLPAFTVVEHWTLKYVWGKSRNWPVASSKNYISNSFFLSEKWSCIVIMCIEYWIDIFSWTLAWILCHWKQLYHHTSHYWSITNTNIAAVRTC
jgi:hypothetical protein